MTSVVRCTAPSGVRSRRVRDAPSVASAAENLRYCLQRSTPLALPAIRRTSACVGAAARSLVASIAPCGGLPVGAYPLLRPSRLPIPTGDVGRATMELPTRVPKPSRIRIEGACRDAPAPMRECVSAHSTERLPRFGGATRPEPLLEALGTVADPAASRTREAGATPNVALGCAFARLRLASYPPRRRRSSKHWGRTLQRLRLYDESSNGIDAGSDPRRVSFLPE